MMRRTKKDASKSKSPPPTTMVTTTVTAIALLLYLMKQHKEISQPEKPGKPTLPKLWATCLYIKPQVCQRGLHLRPPSILGEPEKVGEEDSLW